MPHWHVCISVGNLDGAAKLVTVEQHRAATLLQAIHSHSETGACFSMINSGLDPERCICNAVAGANFCVWGVGPYASLDATFESYPWEEEARGLLDCSWSFYTHSFFQVKMPH